MTIHEFSIIASGLDPQAEDFESRFYDAGCDDATISFQKGHIIVDFAREAESVEDAIASAIVAVLQAGAHVDRIEPDPLVSLSDIAARSSMTRAAMTQYSKGQRGKGFPAPVARVTSDSPLWDWACVARWLYKNAKISREQAVEAAVVKTANDALRSGNVPSKELLKQHSSEYEMAL
jgi:hypothetical protein